MRDYDAVMIEEVDEDVQPAMNTSGIVEFTLYMPGTRSVTNASMRVLENFLGGIQ